MGCCNGIIVKIENRKAMMAWVTIGTCPGWDLYYETSMHGWQMMTGVVDMLVS
jgi:hypothetical protein